MKLPPEEDRLIKHLLHFQRFAVLATLGTDSPYLSLVAFAATADLGSLVFSTPRKTSKYLNISAHPRVAMLIDDRSNQASDIDQAAALTVLGFAEEPAGREKENLLKKLVAKHPQLRQFAASSKNALIKVRTERMIYVTRFQKVKVFSL